MHTMCESTLWHVNTSKTMMIDSTHVSIFNWSDYYSAASERFQNHKFCYCFQPAHTLCPCITAHTLKTKWHDTGNTNTMEICFCCFFFLFSSFLSYNKLINTLRMTQIANTSHSYAYGRRPKNIFFFFQFFSIQSITLNNTNSCAALDTLSFFVCRISVWMFDVWIV